MSLDTSVRAINGSLSLRPAENIIGKYEGCVCTIRVETPRENFESRGTCFVTNQRFVLLSDEKKRTQVMFDTLEIPFERLGVGQYRLPLFSAAYYELEFFLVTSASSEAQRAHLSIHFHEGGADGFRKTLARARENFSQRQQYTEPLRTFYCITN